ncbi:hypothetical protein SCLCIDRAFT_546479 [Scleroderma citrinum Foug A]|uniref:Uncharacterized protein n=1 Tax=Scleroderma citrinum Foug A TaxID=1036808 RepID=A0A0C3D8C2_9AGAM|nr:hypothetical protein SCLCIDRAFT_546479 [Scleroderma citrinum Foug A]
MVNLVSRSIYIGLLGASGCDVALGRRGSRHLSISSSLSPTHFLRFPAGSGRNRLAGLSQLSWSSKPTSRTSSPRQLTLISARFISIVTCRRFAPSPTQPLSSELTAL